MTIDINELRRLAQEATPGPWLFRTAPTSAGLCHIVSAADWKGAFIYGDGIRKGVDDALPKAQELAANARLIAAANPEAISELLDRLEEAEQTVQDCMRIDKEKAQLAQRLEAVEGKLETERMRLVACSIAALGYFEGCIKEYTSASLDDVLNLRKRLEAAEKERDALRARVEQTERQEPVATIHINSITGSPSVDFIPGHRYLHHNSSLYALPGAKPASSEQDASVRKSWARFSHELHRSPDAPYPGMSDAFEQHFSQSFTDREWRAEAATWAAAWKAAKRHGAQPATSVPDTYAAGINAVAAMLQSKADEYAKEHGHDDMGGLSFGPGMGGEIKMDYYTNMIELVDDVRAMLTAAPNVPSVPDGSAVQTSARKENDHVATYRNGT